MLDTEKIKWLKIGGCVLLALVLLLLSFCLGRSTKSTPKTSPAIKRVVKRKPQAGRDLTQGYVKDFLIAYFTKKDLGENRNRYLPFMTEGAYQQEINTEDEPANQAYKGYVVDSKLKSATIYLDKENLVALAQVRYSQTQLQKKNDYSKAQVDVGAETTLKITYTKIDKKYLVSHIAPVLIVDTLTASQEASLSNPSTPIDESTEEGGK